MSENIWKRIQKLLCALKFIQLSNKQVLSRCQTKKTFIYIMCFNSKCMCCYLLLISKQQTLFFQYATKHVFLDLLVRKINLARNI